MVIVYMLLLFVCWFMISVDYWFRVFRCDLDLLFAWVLWVYFVYGCFVLDVYCCLFDCYSFMFGFCLGWLVISLGCLLFGCLLCLCLYFVDFLLWRIWFWFIALRAFGWLDSCYFMWFCCCVWACVLFWLLCFPCCLV